MKNKGYCKITLDTRGKKKVDFGKKWGKMPRKKANASFLRTGNGLIVIDLDQRIIPKKLKKLLGEPTVRTARGWHWYIRTDRKLKTVSGIDKNLDIRAEGGLVFTDYWGREKGIRYERIGDEITSEKVVKKLIEKYPMIVLEEGIGGGGIEGELIDPADTFSKDGVKEMLAALGPEYYDDHDSWLKVGMALKSWGIESGDVEAAWELFDKWSRQSEGHYDERANRRRWKSFTGNGVSIGTLVWMAKNEGWEGEKECYIEEMSPFMKKVCDPVKVNAYLDNSAVERKRMRIVRMSRSGFYREFVKADISAAFDDLLLDGLTKKKLKKLWKKTYGDGDADKGVAEELKNFRQQIWKWLLNRNQFDETRYRSDPWAKNAKMNIVRNTDNTVLEIIVPAKLPTVPWEEDESVMRDFDEHMNGHLDEILDVITAMRFASDRKIGYLWLRASSDWGKSFFFTNVLKELGLVVIISESELKSALKGSPSGMVPSSFITSWMVVFEEFKAAVSELKNITHTISFAPKNRQKVTVDVYGKIFLSAEEVSSLVNDFGAEDQFIRRFSYLEMEGTLSSRKKYRKNEELYRRALIAGVRRRLSERFDRYVSMGEVKAMIEANKVLRKFHDKYPLANGVTLEEGLENARINYFKKMRAEFGNGIWHEEDGYMWSTSTLGVLKEHFLRTEFSEHDRRMLQKKSGVELLNIFKTKKRIDGVRMNVYKYKL